jgi:hypothetical protein
MKNYLPILGILALLFTTCSKSDDLTGGPGEAIPKSGEISSCNASASAVVEQMILNESGSEFFYYLNILDQSGLVIQSVFPRNLSPEHHQEGRNIMVTYNLTQEEHTFVVCLAEHNYDPLNPDVQEMAIIDVCTTQLP